MNNLAKIRPARLPTSTGLLLALLLAVPAASRAHELRAVGPKGEYTLVVGWFIEPAFEGVVNAVDIRVMRTADHKAVNTAKGDVVDLDVEVQYLAAESGDAEVVESMTLPSGPTITFGTDNRYASWFKPVRPGAYAFRIRGRLSDASDTGDGKAGEITLDETFVCGKGSKGDHSFVCLEEPLVFPSGASPDETE